MNKEFAIKQGEAAMERDPRTAPFGFYSGGSFVLDSVRVFNWFESAQDLVRFVLDVETAIFDLEPEGEDAALVAKMSRALEDVAKEGLTEKCRLAFNKVSKDVMVIDWWGSFSELATGQVDFAKELINRFRDLDDDSFAPIDADEVDDFVEFLQTCGC